MKLTIETNLPQELRDDLRDLSGATDKLYALMQKAAANERSGHDYQNRTGRLQRSTQARRTGANEVTVTAGPAGEGGGYHSFVEKRGLSDFTDEVSVAIKEFEDYLEKL